VSPAGGLTNGLPADVISGRDQLQQTAAQLRQAQLWTEPADQTLNTVQQYLANGYPSMLTQHDEVKNRLVASQGKIAGRLDLHNRARSWLE
jgi:hypothetical protein